MNRRLTLDKQTVDGRTIKFNITPRCKFGQVFCQKPGQVFWTPYLQNYTNWWHNGPFYSPHAHPFKGVWICGGEGGGFPPKFAKGVAHGITPQNGKCSVLQSWKQYPKNCTKRNKTDTHILNGMTKWQLCGMWLCQNCYFEA